MLVIDDERAILRSITRLIGHEHDLETLDDARDALSRIGAGASYDVALCDVMMPRMTGLEFLDALRVLDPKAGAGVVFLTGGAFPGSMEQALEKLGNVVLRKPFSPVDLRAAIERAAAGPWSPAPQ